MFEYEDLAQGLESRQAANWLLNVKTLELGSTNEQYCITKTIDIILIGSLLRTARL
jgi:hypothetical protein